MRLLAAGGDGDQARHVLTAFVYFDDNSVV